MEKDWPSGRRCHNSPGAAAPALLLASEAQRQKDQSFPSQVHEHSWGPCVRHGKAGEAKAVLHWRACAAADKEPMHRETCMSSVPFSRHSMGFHDAEL